MFAGSTLWLAQKKSLSAMLKRFKLAGAHPDILAARHPAKAHENGETLILLETLLEERSRLSTVRSDRMSKTHQLKFWVKEPGKDDDAIKQVSCAFSPSAGDMSVKQSLTQLFEGAGLMDEFDMGSGKTPGSSKEEDFASTLQSAHTKAKAYQMETRPLFDLGHRYVHHLRGYGVVVVFQDSKGNASLLTLPENLESIDPTKAAIATERPQQNPELHKFLQDRGLTLFDFSRVGSYSAVERIVGGLERLAKLFDAHRGTIIRKGITVIISASNPQNEITPDGCVRLTMHDVSQWDVFLLGMDPTSWKFLVDMQVDWRQSMARKLHERKRILGRVADMLGVFSVKIHHEIGTSMQWEEELLLRFKADETVIRKTIQKYDIKSSVLKGRGTITFRQSVTSLADESKQVGYLLEADGSLTLASSLTTPQILKALKNNFAESARRVTANAKLNGELERLGTRLGVQIHVDGIWQKHMLISGSDPTEKALRFAGTMNKAFTEVRALLLNASASGWTILISDRFETSATGLLLVPWNAELDTLSRFLIRH